MNDPADLLWVKLRKLFGWHVVNEEVVSDEGVGVDSLLMSLSNSLGEDSWVLRVEQEVDSGKFNVLASHIPLSTVDSALFVP